MYSFFVHDNSGHKNAKGMNKNVVATIIHNEYKDVFLNNECIRHSMNRIQSKDHRIGTYEINKISLFCYDDKIYIKNNEYHRLTFCLPELIIKETVIYSEKLSCQAITMF